jgi:hypothetical protein
LTLAQDSETLLAVISPYHADVASQLRSETVNTEAARLGTTAANIYYCHNYLALQHHDDDATPGVCSQLILTGVQANEFNFAYSEWGYYIVNEPNTVWYVSC